MPITRRGVISAFIVLALIALATTVWAQTSASFDLGWNVIAGGGEQSTSASYTVHGTIGQSMAGPPALTSESYAANSGFWTPAPYPIYLPIIFK